MTDLPDHVDIHEEGPREGFQIEPGPISTEDKIRVSRQVYNDTVLSYENARETVPTDIVAATFGFREKQFFEIEEPAREAPRVTF